MELLDPVEALVTDLLEWIGLQGRSYSDVMEAWRTSCPRLPVWEEANARGYIDKSHQPGHEAWISLTPAGRAHLGAAHLGAAHLGAAHLGRRNLGGAKLGGAHAGLEDQGRSRRR